MTKTQYDINIAQRGFNRWFPIAVIIAVMAGLIALLFLIPTPADARVRTDYGSGTLGPWQTWGHSVDPPGATGDWVDTAYDGDPIADVGIIGDSITAASWTNLSNSLAAQGKTLAVDYWSGRPTTPAVDRALSLTTKPRLLIMAMGTNDIFDPSVMSAQIARLRAGMPATTTVLWVDVQAARPGYELADQRNSGWVNNSIREQCTAPCVVVPWSWWFASNPSRLGLYLNPDGVHTNTAGNAFRASVIMGKLGPLL